MRRGAVLLSDLRGAARKQAAQQIGAARRPLKYGNVKTVLDGLTFDSKSEAARWAALKVLERAGQISELERQVKYPLFINGQRAGTYTADYRYVENGQVKVVDHKGCDDQASRLRRRVCEAIYGIKIEIHRAKPTGRRR